MKETRKRKKVGLAWAFLVGGPLLLAWIGSHITMEVMNLLPGIGEIDKAFAWNLGGLLGVVSFVVIAFWEILHQ